MATPRAIRRGVRVLAAGLSPALLLLLVPAGVAAAAPVTAPTAGTTAVLLDPGDRDSVASAYRDVYLPAAAVTAPAPAADTVSRCRPGTSSDALQQATLDLINYVRTLSGVAPVQLDPGYSAAASRAALMMYANATVSYSPPSSWTCWSEAGQDAVASSNLSGTAAGASVVREYMDDRGAGAVAVARRSRLQRPNVPFMGSGTVGSYNALWVATTRGPVTGPRYTTWPSPGWFPAPLEPAGRWSVTPWNVDDDLSAASVSVTGPDGSAVPLVTHPVNRSWRSLVFELGTLPVPSGDEVDTYTVTVSGITSRGVPIDDYRYQVRLFDPTSTEGAATAPTPLTPPTVTGTARVGEVLTAHAPTWSDPGVTTSLQWLRGGVPVPGATGGRYAVTAADVGQPLAVRSTGSKPGLPEATSTSDPTAAAVRAAATLTVTTTSPAPGEARLHVAVAAPNVDRATGTVEVREGSAVLATDVPLVAGAADVDLTGQTPGTHRYTVGYRGDASVADATTSTTAVVAEGLIPGLTVTAASPAVGRLDLTVGVSAGGQPATGGTVTVTEGARTLQPGLPVSAGTARFRATGLTPGRHTLTVHYSGTGRVQGSSRALTTTVRAKVAPVLKVSATSPKKGRATLAVTVTAPGQPALGGKLTIREGSRTRASGVAVSGGKARWSARGLKSGRHTYTVVWSGSSQVTAGSAKKAIRVR